MLIIPAIEIENGVCTHCIIGEPGTEGLYLDLQQNPEEFIKLLRKENFKALHIIDRGSLLYGDAIDFDLIKRITDAVEIPVELHAGFKSREDCSNAIEVGLYRLVISNNLLLNLNLCKDIVREFSCSQISFAMILDGMDLYDSQLREIYTPEDLTNSLIETGARRLLIGTYDSVFNDIAFDISAYNEIFSKKHFRFTIYGGINSPEKLWELNKNEHSNIDSVILGRSIHTNVFPCQKIWRLIEAELENDKKNLNI